MSIAAQVSDVVLTIFPMYKYKHILSPPPKKKITGLKKKFYYYVIWTMFFYLLWFVKYMDTVRSCKHGSCKPQCLLINLISVSRTTRSLGHVVLFWNLMITQLHVHVPPTKAENKAGQQSAKEVTRNLDKEKSKKKKEDSFCKLRRPIKGDGGVRVLSSVKLLF